MSITTGFEEREEYCGGDDINLSYFSVKDTLELLAHTRALEAMLRKHEFVLETVYSFCPECSGMKTGNGHSTDCQLAKLLGGSKMTRYHGDLIKLFHDTYITEHRMNAGMEAVVNKLELYHADEMREVLLAFDNIRLAIGQDHVCTASGLARDTFDKYRHYLGG